MLFPEAPLEARFLRRYKRFFAEVEREDGSLVTAHCPNTGSLTGCLEPGARVWLRDSHNPERKLRCTWQAIEIDGVWINVDTSLPNRIVAEALGHEELSLTDGLADLRREVPYGSGSRIDLLLTEGDGRSCYVEVKSTTLVDGPLALFPDAVTERGRKHLEELILMARQGHRAVQFFFVNRSDVTSFRPADTIDREYGKALRRAARAGVELHAWAARVGPRELKLAHELEIELPVLPRAVRKRRRKA